MIHPMNGSTERFYTQSSDNDQDLLFVRDKSGGQHKPAECVRFLEYSVLSRWAEAKQHRLCFACFNLGQGIIANTATFV